MQDHCWFFQRRGTSEVESEAWRSLAGSAAAAGRAATGAAATVVAGFTTAGPGAGA